MVNIHTELSLYLNTADHQSRHLSVSTIERMYLGTAAVKAAEYSAQFMTKPFVEATQ